MNILPYCNREKTRKVQKYMKKHPNVSFVDAYNKIFKTKCIDMSKWESTCTETNNKRNEDDTSMKGFNRL